MTATDQGDDRSRQQGHTPDRSAPTTFAAVGANVAGGKPERLGPYLIGDTLGWGGMGIVYQAVDERTGETVAVKLLRFADSDGLSLRRFQMEAEATRDLDHPGIVSMREVGRDGSFDYYSMDLVRGRDLATWLAEERPDADRVAMLFADLARAVDHAHQHGILHRDLKPSNIIVRDDGSPAITDFGLARLIGAESSLTATDQAVGTPQYMSPEQARGQHQGCGPASDVWSLGVMLYEHFGGRSPFAGETVLEIMHCVVEMDPIPLRRLGDRVPVGLERIVMQCLEKDPRDRYTSAADLAADLDRYVAGQSVLARRYSSWTRAWRWTRRRWRAIAILGTVMALTTVLTAMILQRSDDEGMGRWVQAFSWQAGEPLDGMAFRGPHADMEVSPWKDGQHGRQMKATWCWLDELRIAGDVRVELTVRTGSQVDGIEVIFNSALDPEESYGWGKVPLGYGAQFGGHQGTIDFISRNADEQNLNFTYASPSSIRPDSTHRLVCQRVGDVFTLEVDGQEVNRVVFPVPIVGEGLDRIALRCWTGGTQLTGLRIYRIAGTERDPLTVGDTALRLGRIEAAMDEYLAVTDAFPDRDIATRALTRAYLVGRQHKGDGDDRVATIRSRIERTVSDAGVLALLREFDAAAACRRRDWGEAVALMDAAHDEDPDSRIAQRVLETGILPRDRATAQRMLTALSRNRHVCTLRYTDAAIEDISALEGMPLIWLDLKRNDIADISPLVGMPLRYLKLEYNPVSDLRPLSGLPLQLLSLNATDVSDLEPLRGMSIDRLRLSRTKIVDLDPLSGMPLTRLMINDTGVSDLAPLKGSGIRSLALRGTPVEDLSPLTGMPLTYLEVSRTGVRDLTPIAASPLRSLHAEECRIETIPPWSGGQLKRLDLSGTAISDLTPLSGLSLIELHIDATAVTDLSPLGDSELRRVIADDNAIVDVTPLSDLPLKRCSLAGNPIRSLGSFDPADCELIVGDRNQPTPLASIDAMIQAWEYNPQRTALVAGLRSLRVFRTDPQALRGVAQHEAGVEVVFLPVFRTYHEARAIAADLGGRLMHLNEREALRSLLPRGHNIWIESGEAEDGTAFINHWIETRESSDNLHAFAVVWDEGDP